jgi:hypothetical protein
MCEAGVAVVMERELEVKCLMLPVEGPLFLGHVGPSLAVEALH